MASFAAAFRCLQAQGLGVIDVGAREGMAPIFGRLSGLCDVVGFEPDAEEWHRLQGAGDGSSGFRSLRYLPYALGEREGRKTLYLCRSRARSSFYRPNRAFLDRFPHGGIYDVTATAEVPVRSLDALRNDAAVTLPRRIDFIKIDTQGAELDVLRGARAIVANEVAGVEVEVAFARRYEHQPVFREVDALLTSCGLTLFKLRRHEWVRCRYAKQPRLSAGQLVFGDALYLRDPLGDSPRPSPDAHHVEALVVVALAYDLHDVAMELITAPQFAAMLDVTSLIACVRQRSQRFNSVVERLRGMKAALRHEDLVRYAGRWKRSDPNFYSGLSPRWDGWPRL